MKAKAIANSCDSKKSSRWRVKNWLNSALSGIRGARAHFEVRGVPALSIEENLSPAP